MSIFRAYDIRGIYGKDLTDGVMEKIGKALGTLMIRRNLGNELFLGNDIRKSSPNLLKAFIKGITSEGINVTSVGTTSLGLTFFSGWKLKKDVTAYISASHNPPEWNGIKFYDKNCIGFFKEANEEIGRIAEKEDFENVKNIGKVEEANLKEEYKEFLKSSFKFNRPLKVIIDCGNGSTSLVAPDIFKSLENIDAELIFCNTDPNFSDRGADVKRENLQKLRNKVLEKNADIGIAFDGDGDRIGVIDDKGNFVTSEQLAIIISKSLLAEKKGNIIANIECSMILEKILTPLGGKIIRVPVGHTFLVQGVQKHSALLGVEFAQHMVIPSYAPFDDAIIPALKIIEILSNDDKKLSEITSSIPIYPQERINLDCPDELKFKVVENLEKEFLKKFDKVNTIDGLRVYFENGWVLIRVSNTVPTIRMTVEAMDKNELEKIKSEFLEILRKTIESFS